MTVQTRKSFDRKQNARTRKGPKKTVSKSKKDKAK